MNLLPKDKILDSAKLEASADDKVNVAEIAISVFVFDRAEKTVGKEETLVASFSPFPTMFQIKAFPFRIIKLGIVWLNVI